MAGRGRILAVASAMALTMVAGMTAAAAGVDGPCTGSVVIDGVSYGPDNDSPANPIVIPDTDGLVAEWEGSTSSVITDHEGEIGVVVGPGAIRIADWSGENADEETAASGSYAIDDARDQIPFPLVGLYEVSGSHAGDGGTCEGSVMVKIEGNPLSSPIGVAAAGGMLLAAVGLVTAGRVR